jgi:outer membrane protein assembly factor BamB
VGNQVYVASYNGDLAAVDIASGTVLWRRELSAHAGLAADATGIYITDSDDNLWAASPTDGAGRWKQDALSNRNLTAPAIVGNALVVGDLEGYVHWLAMRDGRLLGRERVTKAAAASAPVVAGSTVYLQFENGVVAAVSGTRSARAGGTTEPDAPAPLPVDGQG